MPNEKPITESSLIARLRVLEAFAVCSEVTVHGVVAQITTGRASGDRLILATLKKLVECGFVVKLRCPTSLRNPRGFAWRWNKERLFLIYFTDVTMRELQQIQRKL